MKSLYSQNGIVFWSEAEIQQRRMLEQYFVRRLTECLKIQNRGFEVVQVEAPILTPQALISQQYSSDDVFTTAGDLVLRPETTMGSYAAAKDLLDTYNARKFKLPLVVWQHGKSFRREQDQVTKNMRLKEFCQLEFQILFSADTKNDYGPAVHNEAQSMISAMIGPCRMEPSDRLPSYSRETMDVVHIESSMEVCSISRRTDFEGGNNIEVAIGTDRCVHHSILRGRAGSSSPGP